MKTVASLLLLCFVGLICMVPVTSQGSCKANGEYRLRKELYGRYDDIRRHMLPCHDDDDIPVQLSVGMSVQKILYFDDDDDVITVSAWHRLSWQDTTLKWDPEEYGGIDNLRVPSDLMWRPDLKLYNSLRLGNGEDDDILSVLYFNGEVLYIPPAVNTVHCDRLSHVSDDGPEWTCNFKFGSWVYDGFSIGLKLFEGAGMDLANYTPDNNFDIVNTTAEIHTIFYPCCVEQPFPYAIFTINIRRRDEED